MLKGRPICGEDAVKICLKRKIPWRSLQHLSTPLTPTWRLGPLSILEAPLPLGCIMAPVQVQVTACTPMGAWSVYLQVFMTGSLHCLDTRTLMWRKLASAGPMKKRQSGMITYGNQLLLFGGYGVPSGPIQPGSQLVLDSRCTDGSGWTNELHMFDLGRGEDSTCNSHQLCLNGLVCMLLHMLSFRSIACCFCQPFL